MGTRFRPVSVVGDNNTMLQPCITNLAAGSLGEVAGARNATRSSEAERKAEGGGGRELATVSDRCLGVCMGAAGSY